MKHPDSNDHERNSPEGYSEARIKRLLLDAHNAALLPHKLAMLNIEGQHRLALYRSHYKPNQPRVPAGHPDGGQWTSEGGGGAPISASSLSEQPTPTWSDLLRSGESHRVALEIQQTAAQVDIGHLLTGDPAIDQTTQALTAILARTGEGMDRVGLDPQAFGRLLHAAFALQVKLARLPGIGPNDVETTFGKEPGARYGSKHSISTDVVLRNEAGDIIAIYDVKTGNADLSLRRVLELLEKTGAAPGTPVIQLHLTRGPSRKAEHVGPELPSRHASLLVTGRKV